MHYELADLPLLVHNTCCVQQSIVSQALDAYIIYIAMCHEDVKNK